MEIMTSTVKCSKCGYVYTGVNLQGDCLVGFDIPSDKHKSLLNYKGTIYCSCGGEAIKVRDEIRGY